VLDNFTTTTNDSAAGDRHPIIACKETVKAV
jgi:hypothetical protein